MSDINALAYINNMRYGVVSFIGRGKSGKSMHMYSLLSVCPKLINRPKAMYRFPLVDLFPDEFNCYSVEHFDDVKNGSVLIIEDINRIFPSRKSYDPELQEYLGIISHKNVLIMTTGQNTASGDMAFYRDQDLVTVHKLMDPLGIEFERREFSGYCETANSVINEVSEMSGIHHVFISYIPRFHQSLILDEPPEWYGYDISHALRDVKVRRDKDKGVS